MVANIAHEDERDGLKPPAFNWWVLKAGGELNPKYPGGIGDCAKTPQVRGAHDHIQPSPTCVDDYESRLVRIRPRTEPAIARQWFKRP
jgi:hypothetical protein